GSSPASASAASMASTASARMSLSDRRVGGVSPMPTIAMSLLITVGYSVAVPGRGIPPRRSRLFGEFLLVGRIRQVFGQCLAIGLLERRHIGVGAILAGCDPLRLHALVVDRLLP